MSFKDKMTDQMIKIIYQGMSSPYFMRFSHVLWRQLNQAQEAKMSSQNQLQDIQARIRSLQQTAQKLSAPLFFIKFD
ncbi:hypothetical protein ACFL27_28950, partial [candidate division CSSED10-310 bacterium]